MGEKRAGEDLELGQVGEFAGNREERDGVPAHMLWESKFGFRKEMLPGFLEEAFGMKVRLFLVVSDDCDVDTHFE